MRRKPARLEALENETGVGGASVAFQRRMDLKQRLRRLEAGAARPHFRERPKPKTNTICGLLSCTKPPCRANSQACTQGQDWESYREPSARQSFVISSPF
jgi:hypothetical protein